MRKLKKYLLRFILVLAVLYTLFVLIAPTIVDKDHNKVRQTPPYKVSDEAQKLYNSLDFISDLHCDALLWNRNLIKKNDFGQVDIPRMIDANMAIQAFTIVTKSPKGQNFDQNSSSSDQLTPLFIGQGRMPKAWFNLTGRAISQCEALHKFEKESEGEFRIIKSVADLEQFLSDRKNNKNITSGYLGIEGMHALSGKLENVQVLYDHGVRMMAPTHFFDNKLGGSAHGVSKEGLTDFGKQVIKKMESLNMIVDIAHSSPKLIDDVLVMTTRPIVSSHTGVNGTCNSVRNLSDKHINGIAKTGGLIGIAMFETAVCGIDAAATARAIKYTIELVGVEYVALGSDFDGSVTIPFDVTGLPLIVEELINLGVSNTDIRKVMGGNVKRFMLKNLPKQ